MNRVTADWSFPSKGQAAGCVVDESGSPVGVITEDDILHSLSVWPKLVVCQNHSLGTVGLTRSGWRSLSPKVDATLSDFANVTYLGYVQGAPWNTTVGEWLRGGRDVAAWNLSGNKFAFIYITLKDYPRDMISNHLSRLNFSGVKCHKRALWRAEYKFWNKSETLKHQLVFFMS